LLYNTLESHDLSYKMADKRKSPDALAPNDPRAEDRFFSIGDITYHYILAKPKAKPAATVVLIHGWYV
jgi:hypothetical protein